MVITRRFRATAPQVEHVTEPVLELTEARLDLRLQAAQLEVRAADLGDVLIEYAGHRPVVAYARTGARSMSIEASMFSSTQSCVISGFFARSP